jgi:hypothetical protein
MIFGTGSTVTAYPIQYYLRKAASSKFLRFWVVGNLFLCVFAGPKRMFVADLLLLMGLAVFFVLSILGYAGPNRSASKATLDREAMEVRPLLLWTGLVTGCIYIVYSLATFRRKNPSRIFDRAKQHPRASLFASAD